MLNILKRNWKVPWEVVEVFEENQRHIQQQNIHINHIYREGNQLVDYIANEAANEETSLKYEHFNQLPSRARQILNTDKAQVPALRIRTKPIKIQQL